MKNTFWLTIVCVFTAVFVIIRLAGVSRFKGVPYSGIGVETAAIDGSIKELPAVLTLNDFELPADVFSTHARSDSKGGAAVSLSADFASSGGSSMRVDWKTGGWAELVFTRFPQEWEGYGSLKFDVFNAGDQNASARLRVGDFFDHTGYYENKKKFIFGFDAAPGLNSYSIKAADIASVIDIASKRKLIHLRFYRAGIFYLDNMRLEI